MGSGLRAILLSLASHVLVLGGGVFVSALLSHPSQPLVLDMTQFGGGGGGGDAESATMKGKGRSPENPTVKSILAQAASSVPLEEAPPVLSDAPDAAPVDLAPPPALLETAPGPVGGESGAGAGLGEGRGSGSGEGRGTGQGTGIGSGRGGGAGPGDGSGLDVLRAI